MSGKSAFRMTVLLTLFLMPIVGSAQSEASACPRPLPQVYASAEAACDNLTEAQACLGSGSATATSRAGDATLLTNPGDRYDLANLQRLQTHSMTADPPHWTTLLARLDVIDADGVPSTIDMLVIGDVVWWREDGNTLIEQTAETAIPATIEAAAGVIVRQDSNAASNNIWQLLDGANVSAIGRSSGGEWIRILIPSPNGGAGWVYSRFIAVEGGSELLPYHTNASPVPRSAASTSDLAPAPPSLRMESLPVRDDCAQATDSGILLQSPALARPVELQLNGVTLQLAGAAFITAQVGGNMNVYSLEGSASLTFNDQQIDLPATTAVEIALDASLSAIRVTGARQPFSESVSSELQRLPRQLLPRDFAAQKSPPTAEEAPICPGSIEQSYDNLARYCGNLDPGFACLGNSGSGMAQVAPAAGLSDINFANPGAISPFEQLQQLSLYLQDDPQAIWTTARLELEADTSGGATAVATLLLLGELKLSNRSAPTFSESAAQTVDPPAANSGIEATVQVAGSISVRDQPRVDTDSVALVDDQQTVIALQRSLDQQWLLIETEDGARGWIIAQFLRLTDAMDALPVYDPAQPAPAETAASTDARVESVAGNRLAIDFHSRDAFPECADVPPSGLLIQAPDDMDGALLMTINGAEVELTGAAYLTASADSMTLYNLEGAASFNEPGASSIVFKGEQMTVPLSRGQIAENAAAASQMYSPDDAARFSSLPTDILPRAFDVYVPSPSPAPATAVEDAAEEPAPASELPTAADTPTPAAAANLEAQPAADAADCAIRAGGLARNLRQGPGTDFQVIDVLHIDQSLEGKSQKRGTFGFYWYHTDRGWIRFDAGEMTAGCARLPFYVDAAEEFADE